jgi:myosin heavy subunit
LTSNEKLVESPGRRQEGQSTALEDVDQDLDMAKRENLAFEYTQLLTSQLESQRIYFEDLIAKAVDNRTKAARQAEIDAKVAVEAKRQSEEANALRDALEEKCKQAEKEAARHQNKSQKLEAEVKELRKQYEEARMLADTISENTKAREKEATIKRNELFAKQAKENEALKEQNATQGFYLESLKEQVEDMRVQIDAQAHLQELVKSGQLTQEELDGATITAGSATAQTSTTTTPSRRTKSSRNTQPIMTPRNDPTDEEIKAATAHWIENPYKLGKVASLLRDKIANDWRYTADANEADIIELGLEKEFLMWKKDKTVGLKEGVPSKEIESYLCEASIIAPVALQEFGLAAVDNPERAAKILQAILQGSGYELAPGKNGDDFRNALVQGGVLQPKEEEGLYDSDDGPADGEVAKSKAKKKKKSKKKK